MRSWPIAQNLAFTPWAMEIDPDPAWISAISAAWQQDPDIYLYGPLPKSDNSDTEKGEGGLDLCSIVSLITAARSMEIFRYSNMEYKKSGPGSAAAQSNNLHSEECVLVLLCNHLVAEW